MVFFDFHIHSKYSPCCKEDYTYPDIYKAIKDRGLDGFGVSDHSNYPTFKADFVIEQKKQQKELGLEETGLVGLEISIYNRKGDLGVGKKYLDLIDYKIVSEHIHVAKPFSGFFTTKKKTLHWLKNYPETKEKIEREVSRVIDMDLAAINRFPRSIFGHIFNYPNNVRYVSDVQFERVDEILEALKANNSVLEIHSSHIAFLKMDDEKNRNWSVAGENTPKDLYTYIYKRARGLSLKFSLGSDAHRISDIISKETWSENLKLIGISESDLVDGKYFLEK